jgi:GH15 family glucan-1,4-alpha-glucosidase
LISYFCFFETRRTHPRLDDRSPRYPDQLGSKIAHVLKLCQHEETGAILPALTTSIPEHEGSERNGDYRYCWIRDAYYTVQALNRLGALDVQF